MAWNTARGGHAQPTSALLLAPLPKVESDKTTWLVTALTGRTKICGCPVCTLGLCWRPLNIYEPTRTAFAALSLSLNGGMDSAQCCMVHPSHSLSSLPLLQKKCRSVRRFVGRPIFGLPNLIQKCEEQFLHHQSRRLFRRQHSKAGRGGGGLNISCGKLFLMSEIGTFYGQQTTYSEKYGITVASATRSHPLTSTARR